MVSSENSHIKMTETQDTVQDGVIILQQKSLQLGVDDGTAYFDFDSDVLDIRKDGVSVLQIDANGIQQPQQESEVVFGRVNINTNGVKTLLFVSPVDNLVVVPTFHNPTLKLSEVPMPATPNGGLSDEFLQAETVRLFDMIGHYSLWVSVEYDSVNDRYKYYANHMNVWSGGKIAFIKNKA
jgi:hypothetical protein